jgi:hypothetical protein
MSYITTPSTTHRVKWVNLIPYPMGKFMRGVHWVYLVRSKYSGMYKIGWTTNIKQRMADLPLDQHRIMLGPFRLVHTIATNSGRYLELQLHLLFAHRHSVAEWFRLTDADVDWFIALGGELPEGIPLTTDIVPPLAEPARF